MKIALISTGAHALPSLARTGDSQVLLDLSAALVQLGHEVTLFAPDGTVAADGVKVTTTPLSSTTAEWEQLLGEHCFGELAEHDIVHDCTINKTIHRQWLKDDMPSVATYWSGSAYKPIANGIAQSWAQRDRMMRGASDYEGTQWPENGGPPCEPFREMRVVHNGIDTNFYKPEGEHEDWFLWLGRWHEVRGFRHAIEWARITGLPLRMVGTHPDDDHPAQAAVAREVQALTAGDANISVEFLPFERHHEVKLGYLQRAKALINPFLFQEPFGLQQIEGPACGTPVVSSRGGSAQEVVQEYQTGFTIMSLEEVIEASRRVDRLDRANCRSVTVDRFDRLVMARNYVTVYEEVLGGRSWG